MYSSTFSSEDQYLKIISASSVRVFDRLNEFSLQYDINTYHKVPFSIITPWICHIGVLILYSHTFYCSLLSSLSDIESTNKTKLNVEFSFTKNV